MKSISMFFLIFITLASFAQTSVYRGFDNGLYDFPAGLIKIQNSYYIPGYTLGYPADRRISLLKLRSDLNFLDGKNWRSSDSIPNRVLGSARFNDGILISGGTPDYYSPYPFLTFIDTNGTIVWSRVFSFLPFSNKSLNALLTQADAFTAFSYSDSLRTGFAKLKGAATQEAIAITTFDMNGTGRIRVETACLTETEDEQIIAGTVCIFPDTIGNLMIAKISADSVVWAKQYDGGSFRSEKIITIIKTADNNYIALTSTAFNSNLSLIIKIDTNGNVLWSKEGEQGDHFYGIAESDNGMLSVMGYSDLNTFPTIFRRKFEANGEIVSNDYGYSFSNSFKSFGYLINESGNSITGVGGPNHTVVCRIDLADHDCIFVPFPVGNFINAPIVSDFQLTVGETPSSYIDFPLIPVFTNYSVTDYCDVGFTDAENENPLISPNPSSGEFSLTLPSNWQSTQLRIMDSAGKTVIELNNLNAGTHSMAHLQTGIYIIKCVSASHSWTAKIISVK